MKSENRKRDEVIPKGLDIRDFYEKELDSLRVDSAGKQAMALCPFHDDRHPSLSLNLETGDYYCHGCKDGGSILRFYMKKYNVDYGIALQELAEKAGVGNGRQPMPKKLVETYNYIDEKGELLFQTERYEPKDFRQRRPDGKGGWIRNLDGVRLVPYNLPDVINMRYLRKVLFKGKVLPLQKPPIFIVEGEKDADKLKELGLISTCNAMGAGKWRVEYNQYFRGKRTVIIPDNDKPGRDHAQHVARSLCGIAESVKIIELPGLPEKGDVTDWFEAGETKKKLLELVRETPEWEPKSLLSSLLKWNDILTLDVKIAYLLAGLIPEGSITLMFGRGGIGKTSLSMQIARAVANGSPFCELKTIKTPVYYVDFENPLAVLKERAEKIGESDNLYVWHVSNEIRPPRLDSDEWGQYKQLPPGLIIFDTLRAAHLSDENDSKPMNLIMGRLKELREMGFTILLLHHTPKGSDTIYKGSTALLDLCDHVLGLEEVKEGEHVEFDRENLYKFGSRQKTRYEPNSIYLTFDPEIKGFRLAVDPDIEKMEGILEILKQYADPLNQHDLTERITKDMGMAKGHAGKLLKKGIGQYWNIQKGNKHNAIYYNAVSQFSGPINREETKKQTENVPTSRIIRLRRHVIRNKTA